jgi:hypothetical protein
MKEETSRCLNFLQKDIVHKSFGVCRLLGYRKESDSVNNFMWYIKLPNGDRVWAYDYDITFPDQPTPDKVKQEPDGETIMCSISLDNLKMAQLSLLENHQMRKLLADITGLPIYANVKKL